MKVIGATTRTSWSKSDMYSRENMMQGDLRGISAEINCLQLSDEADNY